MSVRRMGPGDQDLVQAILERFKGYDAHDSVEFRSDPRTILFVAMEGDEPVGWCYGYELVRPEGRREMLLYEVEVAKEAQGRGHGKALVEALLAEAHEREHMEMWVLADPGNETAEGLYRATAARATSQMMFTWDLDR